MFPFKTKDKQPVEQKKQYISYTEMVNAMTCTSTYSDLSVRESILLYLSTPPLRKSVELISNLGSSLPPIVRNKKDNKIQEKHDVLTLLENTSFGVSFKEFMFQACVNYLVTANNYFLLTKSASGKPLGLYNISPAEVTVGTTNNGKIQYYERTLVYNNQSSKTKTVTRFNRTETVTNGFRVAFLDKEGNELWHMKEYNPLNSLYGKSKISTLDDSINGFNVAGKHNRKLIENGCSPTGMFIFKEGLTDAEYSRAEKNLTKSFTGEVNAGKIQILEGDVDYKEAHISPREMDWINGRKFDEKLIYDLYGIPQALIENKASSFNNLSTSMFILYEYTVFTLLDKVYGELTDLLIHNFKGSENLEIYYSKENIPSLDAIKTESTLNKSKTGIYTIDELRIENGLKELPNGEGKLLLNSTEQPQTSDDTAKSIYIDLMKKENYNLAIRELENEGLLDGRNS